MVRQYVGAAQFVGEKIIKPIAKKIFKKQKTTGTEVIDKVKPNVPVTKVDKSKSELKKQIQLTKASGAKLKQTLFESQNKAFKGDDFTFSSTNRKTPKVSEKKAMGGRVGLKRGTGLKRKSNVQKIQETFGPKQKPQSRMTRKKKFPDLTGDGKVTFADILKGRGVINGKKKTKRFV
tara:strand:- start:38 stop:568 length:531 start_codon:yes stop_codon:yes gene_type:complete